MKMCFDKKVVGGLALVGLGVLAVDPQLFGRVLPLLVVAICPLSMVFMMRGMSRGASSGSCSMPGQQDQQERPSEVSGASAAQDAELRSLQEEVNRLRAEVQLRNTSGQRTP